MAGSIIKLPLKCKAIIDIEPRLAVIKFLNNLIREFRIAGRIDKKVVRPAAASSTGTAPRTDITKPKKMITSKCVEMSTKYAKS